MNAAEPLAIPADGGAPPGYRLGPFELRGVVAQDADGLVYRAWDHELALAVAIKEYLPQRLARRNAIGEVEPLNADTAEAFERGRANFADETRLLARCDHASLVRVRQLLRLNGTAYRVMPWYVGWPLLDVRREMTEPPDEPVLRRLLGELLGALQAWHRVGGLHGGVNPARILMRDDDRALLLGPAPGWRAGGGDAGESPPVVGPGCLAPEQLSPAGDAAPGPWSDFFALACVIRYCISGMLPPAPGGPAPEPLPAMVEKLYFDAPHVRYSGHFLQALDAAASPAIGDRPKTAAEFLDWLDHGPPAARSVAEPSPLLARTAHHPTGPGFGLPAGTGSVARAGTETGAGTETEAATQPAAGNRAQAQAHAQQETANVAADGPAAEAPPAGGRDEPVDPATVDLIRRVIESIPERDDAAPRTGWPESDLRFGAPEPALRSGVPEPALHTGVSEPMLRSAVSEPALPTGAPDPAWRIGLPEPELHGAASEPVLRAESPMESVPPWQPPRRGRAAGRWALGALVVAGALGYATWEWGLPEGLEIERLLSLADRAPVTVARPAIPPAAVAGPGTPVATPAEAASDMPITAGGAGAGATGATAATATAATTAAMAAMAASAGADPTGATRARVPAAAQPAAEPAAPLPGSSETTAAQNQAAPASSAAAAAATAAGPPAAVARRPVAAAATPAGRGRRGSPREVCGERKQFSLYRCMQQQCAKAAWAAHAQCRRLKATDRAE